MLANQANSKKQGDVGMGMCIAWFTSRGHTVSIPITDSQDYDLIVDFDGELKKVQVKTTYHKGVSGKYRLNLATKSIYTSKGINRNSVDYVFALTEEGTMYLIPLDEVSNTHDITLNQKFDKFKVSLI